jgi:transposase
MKRFHLNEVEYIQDNEQIQILIYRHKYKVNIHIHIILEKNASIHSKSNQLIKNCISSSSTD